jgi:hypothetical protein
LERCHAGFLGLTKKLCLDFLARKLGRCWSLGRSWRWWWRRRRFDLGFNDRRSFSFSRFAEDAAALDFHDNSILSPMAEALLDLASFDRPLDSKRCAHAQFWFFRFAH